MSDATITYGDTTRIGHPAITQRQGRLVIVDTHIDGAGRDYFVEVDGALYSTCGRCDDRTPGVITWAMHVYDGQCFGCNGAGTRGGAVGSSADMVKIATRRAKGRARTAAKRDADLAAKQAAAAATAAAWREANPVAAALVDEVMADRPTDADDYDGHDAWHRTWGDFACGLAESVGYVTQPGMTERQTEAFIAAAEQAKARNAEKTERAAASAHKGTVGEKKVTITGTVTFRDYYPSDYYGRAGSVLLIVAGTGDDEGITGKAYSSSETFIDVEKGDTITLTGTVKGHDTYQGVAQTVLTRAKAQVIAAAE